MNALDKLKRTPLIYACQEGENTRVPSSVMKLLDSGAIVNITDIGTDISGNRKRICDPMVKRYLNIFAGIIGYQQSKFLTVAKDEPGVYTEPCWVFGENPCKQQQSILSYFE